MRVLVAAVVALVLALPGWGAQPRRTLLKLDSLAPLVVRGFEFGPSEDVAVVASVPAGQQIVNLRASRKGRFVAKFQLRVGRCVPLLVRAIGSLGSRAILQRHPGCTPDERREREPEPKERKPRR